MSKNPLARYSDMERLFLAFIGDTETLEALTGMVKAHVSESPAHRVAALRAMERIRQVIRDAHGALTVELAMLDARQPTREGGVAHLHNGGQGWTLAETATEAG